MFKPKRLYLKKHDYPLGNELKEKFERWTFQLIF